MTIKKMLLSSEEIQIAGQTTLTTTQDWVVPVGVSRISLLGVEPGSPGNSGGSGGTFSPGGSGGLGGRARYLNAIEVSAGQVLVVTIDSNTFSIADKVSGATILNGATGGVSAGRAGTGSTGGAGGSGSGSGGGGGGAGGPALSITNASILVPGIGGGSGGSGNIGNTGGTGGTGQFPGGGGGGGGGGTGSGGGGGPGHGGAGCVRIIWPGDFRVYPNTRTADEVAGEIAWSLVSHPEGSFATSSWGTCNNGGGTWVLLPSTSAAAGLTYYLSADNGRTFQARTFNVGSAALYRNCVWADGFFIVGTSLGTILRSSDGITWTSVTVVSGQAIRASTYNNGVLALALNNKNIYRSADKGLTFTQSTTAAFSGFPTRGASGNGVYLFADGEGNSVRSQDAAVTFTKMASGQFPNGGINLLPTFSENRFMGTTGGNIAYLGNSDATGNFTSSTVPGTGDLGKVTHLASRYYAAGTVSRFMEMKDTGSTWQVPTTLTNNLVDTSLTISHIESDGFGVILVVGNYGLIMRGELK